MLGGCGRGRQKVTPLAMAVDKELSGKKVGPQSLGKQA